MTYIIDAICEGNDVLIFINFIMWLIATIAIPCFIVYIYRTIKLIKEEGL